MSERAPTDAFTELVVDHIACDEVLRDAALLVWALGHDSAPVGDLIHTWVLDRNPTKDDSSLYSELAVLALGMVDWPHVGAAIVSGDPTTPQEHADDEHLSPSQALEAVIDLAAGDDGLPEQLREPLDVLRSRVAGEADGVSSSTSAQK